MPVAKKPKPSDLKAFDLAAAGHDGVLSDESGSLIIKPCTKREVAFYETASAHPEFERWIPTFYGTLQLNDDIQTATRSTNADGKPHDRSTSIVLQNLTKGFKRACVLDCKLGAQLWDEHASLEKRERLDKVAYSTTSGSMGFRVAGMKVWKGEAGGGHKNYDKHYGRVFTKENVVDAFREYFASEIDAEAVKLLTQRFRNMVTEIRGVLENQESRMYSASLLFVYEGDSEAFKAALEEERTRGSESEEKEEDEDVEIHKVGELKLIDFAHADWAPGRGPDENALRGIRSVQALLEELAG